MDLFGAIILFIGGIIAGFIGVNVGSGALITIPLMMSLGLSPVEAIASSRMGALSGSISGWYKFHKAKKIEYKLATIFAIIAVVGAVIGTQVLLRIPEAILERIVGFIILAILIFFIFNKGLGTIKKHKSSKLKRRIGYVSFVFLGFWGGFFGAATGTMAAYVLITLFGQTFLEAAGTRKVSAFFIAVVALIIYALSGVVNWWFGLISFFSAGIGAYIGAGFGIKKGDKWVRILFIIVVCLSAVKLLV